MVFIFFNRNKSFIFKNPNQRNNCVHFFISDLDSVPFGSYIIPGFINDGNNWIFGEIRRKSFVDDGKDSKD